jgi:hypothetical protein
MILIGVRSFGRPSGVVYCTDILELPSCLAARTSLIVNSSAHDDIDSASQTRNRMDPVTRGRSLIIPACGRSLTFAHVHLGLLPSSSPPPRAGTMPWHSEKRAPTVLTSTTGSVEHLPSRNLRGEACPSGPMATEALTGAANQEGCLLPAPATSRAGSVKTQKRARVEGGMRVRWAQFIRRMGTGTAPTESSAFDVSPS